MRSTALAGAFLLGSLWAGGCAPVDEPPAHVILISVDTLRADHVGLLGSARDTTPNIDRFFGDATIFESAASPAPCTLPAVPQFLSGSLVVGREHPDLEDSVDGRTPSDRRPPKGARAPGEVAPAGMDADP